MRCSLCGISVNGLDELKDVNEKTPFSKKSVDAIIDYLAKTAKPPLDEERTGQSYDQICTVCFDDILTYDEYMVKLLQIQKRILSSLRKPLLNEEYVWIQPKEEFLEHEIEIEICIQNKSSGCDDVKSGDENEIKDHTKDFEDAESESDLDETVEETTATTRRYNIPAKCNSCTKIFKNKSQLRRHVNVVHNPSKQIWKCEVCGIITKDEEYLELHRNIHEGKSDLECRYCSKRYTRKINVIRHMHKHWDKKKFQCERCGLRFSERPIYYNHRLQHEAEEDPLICKVCKQSFKTRRTYRNHMWVHREDRPRYSCEICGKTFVEKYTLKVHLRCHSKREGAHSAGRRRASKSLRTEETILECIICGDQFSSQDLYDEHMKVQHDVILKAENIFI